MGSKMKKLSLAFGCLLILSSLLMSQGHSPAALDEANVFTGPNTFVHPGIYTGSSVHSALSVFLNSYTEINNGLSGVRLAPETNAISVGSITPFSATVPGVNGISARMTSNCNAMGKSGPRDHCNTVGGYFVANANVNGAAVWGINPIAQDIAGTTGTQVQGGEFDIGINGAPGFVRGIAIIGLGPGTPPVGSIGLEVTGIQKGGVPSWNRGIQVDDGSSLLHGIQIGATIAGTAAAASLPLAFARIDGVGRHTDVSLKATSPGDLELAAASGRGVVVANGSMIGSGRSSNTDQNGQLTFSNSTTSSSYQFSGTYTSAPICTITPLADPVGQLYISTLTTKTLQFTDTSSVSITVDYHCFKRN
jgi:hypothetical protein